MKVAIEFDEDDESDLETVTLRGDCGELDGLACTFSSIVSATNWDFDAVVASMLQYTSSDYSPMLYKACSEWLEKHQGGEA